MADVLVIAADAGVLVRHWRQRSGAVVPSASHPRLLIDTDGVHGQGSRIVHRLGTVEVVRRGKTISTSAILRSNCLSRCSR